MERYAFDQNYLERLTRGDADVERHFASYFGELLLIKLRARISDPQLVADLRQETFLRVLFAIRRRNAVVYPERLGGFVNSVCENVLLELFRSGKMTVPMEQNLSEPVDHSANVETELITSERSTMVRKVLAEMSENDCRLLKGVFLDGRDKDQICREMEIDRNHLRVRVHRALARFRACFQKEERVTNANATGRGV